MKGYTAPQVTVIDNWEELNIAPATLEWEVDNEKNQIVVTSRYEQVESEDDDDEYRHFKRREEPVEVLRVDCDPAEIEIVKEGVDDEGNKFKTIVTKSQMVAFEIGSNRYELKECMDFDYDEFDLYMSDVDHYYTVAFHKDGRWWFLELNPAHVGLMGYTYWDDEKNEDVEVPFSCKSIHSLNAYDPYVHGEGEYNGEWPMTGSELWVICEDGAVQYGVRFDEGCGDVELLNQYLGDGEVWTKIELIGGSVTVSTQEDETGIKKQWIRNGFYSGVLAAYDRDNEEGVNCDPVEYDILNGQILRIVQGNYMNLYPMKRVYSFGMEAKKEDNELLRDKNEGLYGDLGMEINEKAGGYFVVKQEVPVGSLKKVQYRIVFEDSYIGGTWDDVKIVSCGDAQKPLFKVKKDGYWGMIDNVGTVIVPLRFTGISVKNDGMTTVNGVTLDYALILNEFGKKGWGYLNLDTEGFVQTIPCEYECVEASGNGWVIDEICVEKMGRVATYDLNGRLKEGFKPGRI